MQHLQQLGNHPHERTYYVAGQTPSVLKVFRAPHAWTMRISMQDALLKARMPDIAGIPKWEGFAQVDAVHMAKLGLEHGQWLQGMRPWIEGKTLPDLDDLATHWLSLATKIALRLRDLHDVGCVHADLQPHNVLVDPKQCVWLIDLPLFATSPNEQGHVAGSAPMMAPELWQGQQPTLQTDIYALACLILWMANGGRPCLQAASITAWASAHEQGKHDIPGHLDERLAGVLERMLSHAPEARPQLQHLIDELLHLTDKPMAHPVSLSFDPYQETLKSVLTRHAQAKTSYHQRLIGPQGSGKSRFLDQLAGRLELMGTRVIFIQKNHCIQRMGKINQPTPSPQQGPWRPVLQMIEQLGAASAMDPQRLPPGDQLHTFDWLYRQLKENIGATPICIVWDDFDQISPDVWAWWHDVMEAHGTTNNTHIQLISSQTADHTNHDDDLFLHPPKIRSWGKWRATTSRAEVRDIAQGQWEHLLEQNGHSIGVMLKALNKHLGLFTENEPNIEQQTAKTTWPQVIKKMHQATNYKAFREVCELASNAQSQTKTPCPLDGLALWTQAILAVGTNVSEAQMLIEILGHKNHNARDQDTLLLLKLRLFHGLGQHRAGLDALLEYEEHNKTPSTAMAAAQYRWRAQLLLSSGQLNEAHQVASEGLKQILPNNTTWAQAQTQSITLDDLAHLSVLASASLAIGGDQDAIEALSTLAPQLEAPTISPNLRAKCHAYIAIGLTRNDAREAATDAYLRALREIEDAGLASELPLYLLNVGTAYHKQGRLGLAREYYARGTRVARPTTRPSTRAWLLCNQANIDMILGRLGEAMVLIQRARQVATTHNLHAIDAMAQAFEGYVHFARDEPTKALQIYDACLERKTGLSTHLQAELHLHSVEVLLKQESIEHANQTLNQARQLIDRHHIAALKDYLGILQARLQWVDGDTMGLMGGIELFRRRLIGAQDAGNYKLVLQQSPYLLRRLNQEGLAELGEETTQLVNRAKNAIAMGLTRELRDDFFKNLPNLQITAKRQPEAIQDQRETINVDQTITARFYRMLSLNEVILHTTKLEDLWPRALDIALSLSGAERGFLLLKTGQRENLNFEICASRDIDGEAIAKPHLKVSLTIAQEAAQTGRTVVTLNAREDKRFNVALSVVDLDLTSVLCVPVRDGQGLLGALYLDHRFKPGMFHGEVARMMEAFGHQLALAMTNIERLNALETEREKLKAAHKELGALLSEREARLEGLQERLSQLSQEVERRRDNTDLRDNFSEIAFTSKAMERVLLQVDRIARSDIPVVIIGESGTGKELIARAVHDSSPRSGGPFVALNCGAVSETLFESEMFGHIKGAFTGATMNRQGMFQAANGGTIFLDELGEMPLNMQVKLLRVLQEHKVRRLGTTQSEPIDVRIVAATNKDLQAMIEEGTFREDLYYRLAAFTLKIPPLRARREDIALIAHKLLAQISMDIVQRPLRLTPETVVLLSECAWPGNVRELENTLRAACVLCDGDEITERELASLVTLRQTDDFTPTSKATHVGRARPRPGKRGRKPKATRQDIIDALNAHPEDRALAAQSLGVSERTLYRYLLKYDM